MQELMTVKKFCRTYYEIGDSEEPTKTQQNAVARMCRDGSIPAQKLGKKWFVKVGELERKANV